MGLRVPTMCLQVGGKVAADAELARTLAEAEQAASLLAEAARLAGISVRLCRSVTYAIAGALAALGGIVAMSQLRAGDPKAGEGLEFDAITAVVLGGTSLFGGEGKLLGVLVGAVFMGTLSTGMNQANIDSNYQSIIKGAVLVAAVLIDTALRRRGRR